MHSTHRRLSAWPTVALVGGISLLSSCGAPAPTRPSAERDEPIRDVHASNEPALDAATRDRLAQMDQAMAANADGRRRAPDGFEIEDPPPARGAARTDFWEPVEAKADANEIAPASVEADGVAARTPEPRRVAPEGPALSRSERIRHDIGEIASLLRDDAREVGFMLPAWVRIAALEAIEPGALSAHYSGAGAQTSLSQPEHEFLTAWRDLHTGIWENADSGDVAHLAEIVQLAGERMSALKPLAIVRTALCNRVERYGVYDERKTYDGVHKLLAGKRQRLLVYIELENFAHRESFEGGVDGFNVDLTVGLALHHLGRDTELLAWRMADEEVSVFSRNHRREFFLTIIADLPETLSVDSYNLKAHVIDENSGAVAEQLVRIDVVADPSAFR